LQELISSLESNNNTLNITQEAFERLKQNILDCKRSYSCKEVRSSQVEANERVNPTTSGTKRSKRIKNRISLIKEASRINNIIKEMDYSLKTIKIIDTGKYEVMLSCSLFKLNTVSWFYKNF
jgi:predicted  nucleic acid-binding Zn-ribbon protein